MISRRGVGGKDEFTRRQTDTRILLFLGDIDGREREREEIVIGGQIIHISVDILDIPPRIGLE